MWGNPWVVHRSLCRTGACTATPELHGAGAAFVPALGAHRGQQQGRVRSLLADSAQHWGGGTCWPRQALLTARSAFQDPGASFDVNDQDPDPQPRYTQMNDNR